MSLLPVIIGFFILMFISLGFACYFMLNDTASSTRTVKSLTARISLSLILFGVLIFAFMMGWIHPHALGA